MLKWIGVLVVVLGFGAWAFGKDEVRRAKGEGPEVPTLESVSPEVREAIERGALRAAARQKEAAGGLGVEELSQDLDSIIQKEELAIFEVIYDHKTGKYRKVGDVEAGLVLEQDDIFWKGVYDRLTQLYEGDGFSKSYFSSNFLRYLVFLRSGFRGEKVSLRVEDVFSPEEIRLFDDIIEEGTRDTIQGVFQGVLRFRDKRIDLKNTEIEILKEEKAALSKRIRVLEKRVKQLEGGG